MKSVKIPINDRFIEADLTISSNKVIIFAHGSGSSRFSIRNRFVASILQKAGFSTLLLDLLTKDEDAIDKITAEYRFNIELLSERLVYSVKWLEDNLAIDGIGYFGASTGAAAALIAAAKYANNIKAIVSRGGRVDLAIYYIPKVKAPTLMIVGEKDDLVLQLNKKSMRYFKTINKLSIIPNASHLFEEEGALEKVGEEAKAWFTKYLDQA